MSAQSNAQINVENVGLISKAVWVVEGLKKRMGLFVPQDFDWTLSVCGSGGVVFQYWWIPGSVNCVWEIESSDVGALIGIVERDLIWPAIRSDAKCRTQRYRQLQPVIEDAVVQRLRKAS